MFHYRIARFRRVNVPFEAMAIPPNIRRLSLTCVADEIRPAPWSARANLPEAADEKVKTSLILNNRKWGMMVPHYIYHISQNTKMPALDG